MKNKKTTEELWEKTLTEIEFDISKANFNTWFKNTFAVKQKGPIFQIAVPNEFVKEWLTTKFNKIILKYLRKSTTSIKRIEYIISSKKEILNKKSKKEIFFDKKIKKLPLQKYLVNTKNNLNSRYTLNNFVIGPFNELAYSASLAIIKKLGVYNPLFIYGSTGLGKTHLIQAVGNSVKENDPDLKIFYTSSENFAQDYVNALKNNRVNIYKNKYRSYDFLIMDDIQFLSGKEKIQEELFHLFNILYNKGKQIIFSSDKHPNYIFGLEDRLKSRFSAGMIVDITKPDFESRMAILKQKASNVNFYLDNEICEYVAKHVEGNIRELEGILNSIICQRELKNRDLKILEIKNLIKNNIKPKSNISVKKIVEVISGFYNLEPSIIYEKVRRKEIVYTRQIIMYILREYYNLSFPLIGNEIGGRDHTTVIHSHTRIKKLLEKDPSITQEIEQLRAILTI